MLYLNADTAQLIAIIVVVVITCAVVVVSLARFVEYLIDVITNV